jgi:hypothetical protein
MQVDWGLGLSAGCAWWYVLGDLRLAAGTQAAGVPHSGCSMEQ